MKLKQDIFFQKSGFWSQLIHPQKMSTILIRNARLVNRGQIQEADVLVKAGRIAKIAASIQDSAEVEIDASGKYLIPGIIDDQVHFREPGLTH